MRTRLKAVVATTAVVALTSAGLLASVGAASATGTTPSWEPDPNTVAPYGQVVLYDAAGNVLTGGTNISHLADYAAVTSGADTGANKASLIFALPDHTKSDQLSWSTGAGSGSSVFPVGSTGPKQLQAPFANPTVTIDANNANLTNFIAANTVDTSAGYKDIFQLRVKDSGSGGAGSDPSYWSTDIALTRSAAGTITGWTVVYPTMNVTATALTQTAGPASPQVSGSNGTTPTSQAITLTSTTSPAAAGTAQFFDGTTSLGTVAVPASGIVALATTPAPVASGGAAVTHSYTSRFVATGGTTTTGSTSAAYPYTVSQVVTATTTTLAYSGGTTAYSAQSFTATVAPSAATGSVVFNDTFNGTTTAIAGTVVANAGTYTLSTSALGQGSHSVVANFTATGSYGSSASAPTTFALAASACEGNPQSYPTGTACSQASGVQVVVDPGYLTVSTPYTAAHPYILPTMAMNATGTMLSTTANFPNVAGVAGSTGTDAPLTITSTLAGDPNWVASCTASDLVGVLGTAKSGTNDVIDAQNIGLSNWKTVGTPSNSASAFTYASNVAAAGIQPGSGTGTAGLKGAPKSFASTTGGGNGTLQAYGLLTINAPTNTVADTYNGTITFSVV